MQRIVRRVTLDFLDDYRVRVQIQDARPVGELGGAFVDKFSVYVPWGCASVCLDKLAPGEYEALKGIFPPVVVGVERTTIKQPDTENAGASNA